jgi:hypothetical protein
MLNLLPGVETRDSGESGGAIVNIVTRNGTKDYHGSVYWYKRHEMFNANSWSNKITRFALDNWQLSGITMFASGEPSGISFTQPLSDLTGVGDGQRININGNPNLPYGERVWNRMFDTSVFSLPGKNDPGNAPVTCVRGPGRNNWDMTVFKNFPIRSEARQLQFRWKLKFGDRHLLILASSSRFEVAHPAQD